MTLWATNLTCFLYGCLYTCISPLHTRSAGSGVQVPTADTPSGDTQVALILPDGIYPGLHLKNIWAPPTVRMLWMFSMIPFSGAWGTPQLTRGRKLMLKIANYHTHKNYYSSCSLLLIRMTCYFTRHLNINHRNQPSLHLRSAGFGLHPLSVHTALILPSGTRCWSHL